MIYITRQLLQEIKIQGEQKYPQECCGIIFGKLKDNQEKIAEWIEPVENSFESSETYHRFMISPEIMMRAEQKARKDKKDVVGFYHSHPNQPALPSEYDRAHALPVYSYFITSVVKGEAVDIRGYELVRTKEDWQFCPEKQCLTDE